ncbi:hypothetical protein E2C01_013009 [Portunus trituberculatus]|uniref:Uncharacterized protein n=1 Tax=Portunus trituberculatus TaxID=210409 RepID=A0A5B7DFY2_PORTR|nr:hypothetical protein [Portunus trituberculatus]
MKDSELTLSVRPSPQDLNSCSGDPLAPTVHTDPMYHDFNVWPINTWADILYVYVWQMTAGHKRPRNYAQIILVHPYQHLVQQSRVTVATSPTHGT